MYTALQYKPDATVLDALRDIVGILSGSITNLNQVSDTINKDNSIIVTTTPSGWELWDDRITEEDYAVLRAPISDDPSRYKYIRLELFNSDRVIWVNYKDWDKTSHTGTSLPRTYTSSSTGSIDFNSVLYRNDKNMDSLTLLSASSKHFAGICMYDNITSTQGMSIVSEHTRRSPWDTVENGQIPIMFNSNPIAHDSFSSDRNGNQYFFYKPEYINQSGTLVDYSANPASYKNSCLMYMFNSVYSCESASNTVSEDFTMSETVADENKNPIPMLFPFGGSRASFANLGGEISEMSNIYFTSTKYNLNSTNDILQIGSDRYRIWSVSSTDYPSFAVLEK